jgi:hypothetical protein
MRPDSKALHSNAAGAQIDPRRVLLVFALYFYAFVWLVQSVLTKNAWLNNLVPWRIVILQATGHVTMLHSAAVCCSFQRRS